MKGLANIPDDWISGYIDYVIRWPNSDQWQAILRGQLTDPHFEDFWDLNSGDPTNAMNAMPPTFDINLHLQEGAIVNAGFIWHYAGSTIPDGWLVCDGSAISRTTYARLFAAIGTLYGSGDGTTTFNLPYVAGRTVVGRDITDADFNILGLFGGQKNVTLEVTEIPEHTHTQNAHNHTQLQHNHVQNGHNHTQNAHNHTQNAHSHTATFSALAASGANQFIIQTAGGGSQAVAATTPTNVATTATNQVTTPINQAEIAENIAATATNQNTGGGNAHNNLQPYIVFNTLIKT